MTPVSFRFGLLSAGALATSCLLSSAAHAGLVPPSADWGNASTKESSGSAFVGYASSKGNRATFEHRTQTHEGFVWGVDEFQGKNHIEGTDFDLTLNFRGIAGNEDYDLVALLESEKLGLSFELGGSLMRVFYDGGGGTAATPFEIYDETMHIDRSKVWIEGTLTKEAWWATVRYEHQGREGKKDSTSWGSFGGFKLAPSFWDIDETRDIITVDVGYEQDAILAEAGLRWENSDVKDSLNTRPNLTAGNFLTQRERNDTDLFAAHGFVQATIGEKLILSGGAIRTTLDANLDGNSRIWGTTYDPEVVSPAYPGRGSRDHGFADVTGDAEWKQTVLNGNAVFLPAKGWKLRGSLRFENQEQEAMAEFTDIVAGALTDELETASNRDYDEISSTLDLTYNGIANWVLGATLDLADGSGDLTEDEVLIEDGAVELLRMTAFDREHSQLGLSARWYPASGVNLAFGYVTRSQENTYDTSADFEGENPSPGTYPAFITRQKFSTDDLYGRVTWRLPRGVSITGRYDYKDTTIKTGEQGITDVPSADIESHIISAVVTWTPISQFLLQGTINQNWDQMVSGAAKFDHPAGHASGRFDNNYRTYSLLALVLVSEKTDIQAEFTRGDADNWRTLIAAYSLPLGMEYTDTTFAVSMNTRVSDDLAVGLRYAHADYDEPSAGGSRDYTADMIYGRVQLRF